MSPKSGSGTSQCEIDEELTEVLVVDKITVHQINQNAPRSGIKIRIGEQWVDITKVGDILIEAGRSFNAAFGIKADDDA